MDLSATLSSLPSTLDAISDIYNAVPTDVLLIGHSLCVAAMMRKLRDRYLLSYWVCCCIVADQHHQANQQVSFIAAFGGGVVSALLLCDRHVAPNPLFASNMLGIIWTACWWAVNYFPGDIVFSLQQLLPIRMACRVCLSILRIGLIVARVDLAVKLFPGVIAAPLVLGTVAGSAGKFVADAVLVVVQPTAPTELAMPGFVWRSGFLCSAAYYVSTHVLHALTAQQGRALMLTLFVAHGMVSDIVGSACDFTEPIANVLHVLLNVPRPTAITASRAKKHA